MLSPVFSSLLAPVERFLGASARQGSPLLVAGIFAGLILPPLSHALHPTLTLNVVVNTTLILTRLDVRAGLNHLRRIGSLTLMVAFMMIASPLLTHFVIAPLPLDAGVATGLVIFATGCGVISGAALARLAGLDAELALVLTMSTTVLLPLIAPPLALSLAGVDLALTVSGMASRLALVVGLPILGATALHFLAGRERLRAHAPAMDGMTVWLMVEYAVAVMDGLTARILHDPLWVAQALVAVFAISLILNGLGTLVFFRLGALRAATFGLLAGNRNMALYLAVLPAGADPRIVMFFALTQFPLYITPVMLIPLYHRLLRRKP